MIFEKIDCETLANKHVFFFFMNFHLGHYGIFLLPCVPTYLITREITECKLTIFLQKLLIVIYSALKQNLDTLLKSS